MRSNMLDVESDVTSQAQRLRGLLALGGSSSTVDEQHPHAAEEKPDAAGSDAAVRSADADLHQAGDEGSGAVLFELRSQISSLEAKVCVEAKSMQEFREEMRSEMARAVAAQNELRDIVQTIAISCSQWQAQNSVYVINDDTLDDGTRRAGHGSA